MEPKIWIKNSTKVQPMFKHESEYAYNPRSTDGLSILFAGCSITANVGLKTTPDGGWSSMLKDMLSEHESVSVSNNCSISGASTFEIISNIFRFLNNYEKPDIIFLLLPLVKREMPAYTRTTEASIVIDYNMFLILDNFCRAHGIKLFASTWDFYIPGVTSWFTDNDTLNSTESTFNTFKSFFAPDKIKFAQDVFEASSYGHLSLEGENNHPAEPIHMGYARMFYEEYTKRK